VRSARKAPDIKPTHASLDFSKPRQNITRSNSL
jgi:hypothetical protein